MSLSPIALFAYNRADHFRQTFDALSKCKEAPDSVLYIFSDGSPDRSNDEKVRRVREEIEKASSENKFLSVNIVKADGNKGLARSIIDGVTSVVEKHGRIIVLEDDCVCSPYFLKYMNACLDAFENDKSIGSIAGFTPPIKLPKAYKHDIFSAYRSCSCAWATWADRWQGVDWQMRECERFIHDRKLRARLNANGSDRFIRYLRQSRGKGNSWSIRFGAYHALNDYTVIYPTCSYIKNIGADGSGVHTKKKEAGAVEVSISEAKKDPIIESVTLQQSIQKRMKSYYSGGFVGEIKKQIKTRLMLLGSK